MSKKWIYILAGLFAFSIYFLFQFDAELRRRNNVLSDRVGRLEAKVSAFIRHEEKKDSTETISRITTSTDSLRDDLNSYQKRTAQLFELLIEKDETFDKRLKRFKNTTKGPSLEKDTAQKTPDGFEELK